MTPPPVNFRIQHLRYVYVAAANYRKPWCSNSGHPTLSFNP